jgi:hypothetical protein
MSEVNHKDGGPNWTPHHGGDCPVPGETMVEVKWNFDPPDDFVSDPTKALEYRWTHSGREGDDIIAYRVLREAPPADDGEGVARAFICEYCGLYPEHVSRADILRFMTGKSDAVRGLKAALRAAGYNIVRQS